MRPGGAVKVLLAGLLTGGLIASGATPVFARPERGAATTVTARLAPPVVTLGEPAAVVAQVPAAQQGRPLTVEGYTGGTWAALDETTADAAGRAVVPVDTTVAGSQRLRVVAAAWNGRGAAFSTPVTLSVRTASSCTPRTPLVDRQAGLAARCLAARLDRWRSAGLMGVGQQLNMSSQQYADPLTALGDRRVSVVGFDLWELGKTATYDFPFFDEAFDGLVAQAQAGAVLTASWHAPNPHTGRAYGDRSWHDLGALLRDTPEAATFWAQYDEQLGVLSALQDQGVAVVFRPFHEANGDWFWWGRPDAAVFKKVYAAMQQRAWTAGVHNVVWAYSFAAANRPGITAPEKLIPAQVDLAGIDTYYPSTGAHRTQAPSMAGYAAVAASGRVPRMAFTEIGPSADTRKAWPASTITATARSQVRKPVWALLWVDDGAGYKQISSLDGGLRWLDSCPFGFCRL